MAGLVGRGMCWGKRGRGSRGGGALLALGLLAALGFLAWRHGPSPRRAARGVLPPPPSPVDAEQLRKPVYAKPDLEPGALGELGRAVRLELSPAEKRLQEESIRRHQINIYLSDRISLHRRLPERWHPLLFGLEDKQAAEGCLLLSHGTMNFMHEEDEAPGATSLLHESMCCEV